MSTADRFWIKVDAREGECWQWLAATARGYGRFWLNGRYVPAHRWVYQQLVGPIPDGLVIDHLCRNRACVNPDHLEPVTQQENTLRGATAPARNAVKLFCPSGHPYVGENLRVATNGGRVCRACHRRNAARHRARSVA